MLEEQKVDWLTAMEVKIKLDQAEAKANDAGSGPCFCGSSCASETCPVPLNVAAAE